MGEFPPWVYIVIIGAIAVVYGIMIPKRSNAKTADTAVSATVEKVEDTLEHYMTEIEKENEEIIDLVSQIKQESTAKQLALQEQVSEMRQRLMELEQKAAVAPVQPVYQPIPVVPAGIEIAAAPAEMKGFNQQGEALRQSAARMMEEQAAASPVQKEVEETSAEKIQNRYPELFKLHESGKSVDTIAKAVGLQRGEVLLILQLAKQEEQS
ncbi:hypothetical protein [Paenibacillus bovis]|uniref:Uncharacterized protein n=1 Tax=Paenibacillus bovis TaxID=1616788 RepID=A0A172ZG19_9BACL|nr:hypothetical protein [Paenibacillus bovis]ANF96548.1 hypothetical protein AR543_11375 [Paenibacillus bovis]